MRVKKYFFLLFFLPFPAYAMPDKTRVEVSYHTGEINYIHENTDIKCSQNKQGGIVLGCARDKKNVKMHVICSKRLIQIDFFSKDREVEIHSDLKKGTCEYNDVLDHEMTHMNLHADALQNVVNKGMSEIVDAFDGPFKTGKGCNAAVRSAEEAFKRFVRSYNEEDRRINHDFDRNDVDSVVLNCKTPPTVNVFFQREKVQYVSTDPVECKWFGGRCLQEKDASACKKLPLLSCTEMPLGVRSDFKAYLAQVDITVSTAGIKTEISSRYPVHSCGYKMLKKREKERIRAMEGVISEFTETVKPVIEREYTRGLEKNFSIKDLSAAVQSVLKKHVKKMERKLSEKGASVNLLTERGIKAECSKKEF